tara:strand:+ start:477 stop:704 length:228 start_codon:yes stop_codon:yes gene_type:complete
MLILYICTSIGGVCDTWVKETHFDDWDSCMRMGYSNSLDLIKEAGPEYVNKHRMYIKFRCQKVPPKKDNKIEKGV